MPASGYSYSTDDVRDGATILRNHHTAFLDEINRLETAVLEATGGWQGAAGDAFRLTTSNIKKSLETVATGIETTSQTLTQLAADVEEGDSESAGRLRGMGR
ncbi:WXG100 family type VII secretion target [Streptomyces sp. NPDC057271]|uniref:WXG100 family type VII secretion target n=1 Tax=unclassified Streptomyces TaxID=2593676 RepID=UPI00362FFDFD